MILMLNLINLLKKSVIYTSYGKGGNTRAHKRNIPMNKEWYNSLYSFDKNSIRALPAIYNYTYKLLKSYFNLDSDWINNKTRHLSKQKLWISNPEIKHYNDKINITIYIYNDAYNSYKKKLELLQYIGGPKLEVKKYLKTGNIENFESLKQDLAVYIGTNKSILDKNHDFYQKVIAWLKLNKYTRMAQYRLNIINFIKQGQQHQLSKFLNLLRIQNHNYLINLFNKELLYLKFKQKMLFSEFKYNEVYLSNVVKSVGAIYNKKVELNIVTLKYFWLNTSILLQILTDKVKDPKNRGRYLLSLNHAMEKIKVPVLSKDKLAGEIKPYMGIQNIRLNQLIGNEKDLLNQFVVQNSKKSKIWLNSNIDGLVLTSLENKIVAGVFLKIAGRLTKRYKAQRAVTKLRFKGTLKNVYSAHRNYSSSLSRGYSNINVEKARMNSNVRIGAFGMTGWVASY